MSDIRSIDFGRDTAEYDGHLSEYFLETLAYEQMVAGGKSLIIGRKGTGKTAIVKYTTAREHTAREYVVKIEASHSTYVKIDETLRSFTSQIKNLDSSFKLGWLFATLLALLDRLTRETTMAVTREEAELYTFARSQLSYNPEDPISALAGYVFSWIKNLKAIGGVEREVQAEAKVDYFDEPRVLHLVKAAIERINAKGKVVYLLFDRLDERWDGSELYISFLQGLLLAVKDIKATGLNVRPVVFLRDDIFDAATEAFQHIDHYRMEIQRITWDERSLLELIAKRIRSSLVRAGTRLSDGESPESLWRLAFPTDIPHRRAPIPSHAYMIERTLFRPRDIILFASRAKEVAVAHRHALVENEDIFEAEQGYSKEKLRDLVAEWSYKFPGLDQVLQSFRRGPIGFDRDELRFKLLEIVDALGPQLHWLPRDDEPLLRLLYSLGFLSFTTRGGVLRGTRVIHSAIEADPTVVLEQERIFITPMFRRALDLRDH